MLSTACLATVKSYFEFSPTGDATGNLTVGRGRATLEGAAAPVQLLMAIVENKIASGSLGIGECDKLASLFKVAAARKCPLILYIDSAGARLSEGLAALGAFRHMYRAALGAAAAGGPFTVFCGANCFGGASMLAALAGTRVYSTNTRFAMSGPSILAQAAGISALDDIFMAMSMAAISGEARAKLGAAEMMAGNGALALPPRAIAHAPADRHVLLGARLVQSRLAPHAGPGDKLERKDLAKLYPGGYRVEARDGILSGEALYDGQRVALAGFVGRKGTALDAKRAWLQADALWKMLSAGASARPQILHMLVDCESHATSLDDERIMLSAYLVDLACALHALAQSGTHIETTVLGKLGGGVYVALSAPVASVNLLHGAEIQLLPGAAIASILGDAALQKHQFDEYQTARVADRELKLGIV